MTALNPLRKHPEFSIGHATRLIAGLGVCVPKTTCSGSVPGFWFSE